MYKIETAWDFRRRRAVESLEQGESPATVARVLDVSCESVKRWLRMFHNGQSLKTQARGGRPRRLSGEHIESLRQMLLEGATAHGWHNNLWTSKRVRQVIAKNFGITFSLQQTWVVLRQYLGWTVQRPIQQLRERDDAQIDLWKSVVFPRILQQVSELGAYLAFVDESGFMLAPTIRRTFAPRGHTPVNKVSDPHGRISAIGALIVCPSRRILRLKYRLLDDNANFRGDSVLQFVEALRCSIRRTLVFMWDAIPIHRAEALKQYFRKHDRLNMHYFPPYAPELNPVDKVWFHLKFNRLANLLQQRSLT